MILSKDQRGKLVEGNLYDLLIYLTAQARLPSSACLLHCHDGDGYSKPRDASFGFLFIRKERDTEGEL